MYIYIDIYIYIYIYTRIFCFPHFCALEFLDSSELAVEALFFLGVLFAVGGLERVGILKAGRSRVSKRKWDEIFKISGSSWNVKYDFLKMIPNDI